MKLHTVFKNRGGASIKAKIALFAGVICALSVGVVSVNSAHAASTPETCFAFNNGLIYGYYDNENNDPWQPACPRDVVIPAAINGQAVTEIGQHVFWKNISSVILPDGLTKIGNNAFHSTRLTSVVIPDSVTEIGEAAFYGSLDLKSVTLSKNIKIISPAAFAHTGLTSVVIPDSVTEIGEAAFYESSELKSVTLSKNIKIISPLAFYSTRLTSVVIPDSVTKIGKAAFYLNRLTSISIPDSLTEIGEGAFYYNDLRSVTIPSHLRDLFNEDSFFYQVDNPNTMLWQYFDHDVDSRDECDASANPEVCRAYFDANLRYVQVFIDEPGDNLKSIGISYEGINYGGMIINPRPVTVRYVDEQGKEVAPALTAVGMNNGTPILDYYTEHSPTLPDATGSNNAEIAEIINAAYYHDGGEATVQAQKISGYDLVSPESQSITVGKNSDTVTFVYKKQPAPVEPEVPAEPTEPIKNENNETSAAKSPDAPNTGEQMMSAQLWLPVLGVIGLGALVARKWL